MSRSSSAVVDSKVVEMSLDNQNFEKNAEVSIGTIKKLQEALKFSNSTDGLDKVNASVKKVKFDSLLSGIDQAKSGFSAMEAVAFGAFANIGKKVSDLALKIGTAIPRQIIEGGKSRALNVEQAMFQINGLAEQTGATFKDVKKSIDNAVQDTAYGFDEAAVAASQLLASSVQVGEQMDHALLAISGVSAMTGSSYGEIAHIFTTIAGNGKLMTEQLNQFSVRGLNAAATLADQLGVTEEEVREMVHKGEIDFQTFADAMDNAFGKHAKDANKTFTGAFSNIKAVFSRIGQKFIGPGMEAMTKVFNHLLPVLKEVEARIGLVADKVTPLFDTIANGVSGALDVIYSALTGKDPVKDAAEEAESAATQTLSDLDKIRKTAIDVIRGDYGNGQERINKLTEEGFDAQKVQDYVNKVHELTGGTWDLNDAVLAQTDAFFGSYDAMSKLSDDDLKAAGMSDEDIASFRASAEAAKDLADNEKKAAENAEDLDVRTRFVKGLQNIFGGVSKVFGDIGKTIQTKFAGLTKKDFDPIDFLSKKFFEFSQNFDKFVNEHSGDIANIFGGLVSAVMMAVGAVRTFGTIIWNFLGGVFDAFGTNILEFAGNVGDLVSKFHSWLTETNIVGKALTWFRGTVEGAAKKVKGFFDGFIKMPRVQAGLTKFKTAFTDTFKNFPKHFEGTKKAFSDFKDRVREMGGIRLDNIVQVFTDFKDNVVGQFLDFEPFKKIKEGVVDVALSVRKHFDEMSVDAEGNETVFGKVWHAITAGYDWIAEKASTAKEKVLEFWDKFKLGDFFSKQLTNFGMAFEQLGSHLVNFFKGLPGVIGDFWGQVMDSGGFKFDNLGNIIDIFKDTIGKYFKDFHGFDGFTGAFAVLKEDLKAKLAEMGIDVDAWKEKIIGWKDSVIATIQGIPDAIANFSLPEAFQKFMDFLTGNESDEAVKGAEGVTKSVDEMNQTITSSMDKKFMSAAMPVVSFFSEDVAAEIQENADSMDKTTKGFFGKTLGEYLPGVAAVLDKVFGDIGTLFLNVFEDMSKAFGELKPGWIWDLIHALLGFGALIVLGKVAVAIGSFMSALGAQKKAEAKNLKANAWLKMAAAIAIIAFTMSKIAEMPIEDILKAGAVIVLLGLFMVLVNTNLGKGNASRRAQSGLLQTAEAIAVLAVVATVLGLIPMDILISGLKKLAIIAGLLLATVALLALINLIPGAKNATKGIKDLGITFAILSGLAVALGLIPTDLFLEGLKKLGMIAGVIVGTLLAIALINKFIGPAQKVTRDLAILFGVMTVCFIALSFLNDDQISQGLDALTSIAGVLVITLAGIAAVNRWIGPAQSSVKGLALLFGVMAASLVALSLLDPDKLKLAIVAMGLMGALAVALTVVASKFKVDTSAIFKMIGVMAALAAIVTIVAAITDHFDIQANLETFKSLSLLMIAMGATMVLIAIAGKIAGPAMIGMGSLIELAVVAVAMIAAIGAIAWALGKWGGEGLQKEIQSGIEIIKTLMNGIAEIVTGAIQTALNALPAMADSLVEFMEHLAKLNDVPYVSLGKIGETVLLFLGTEIMGAIAGALDLILGDQMSSGMARLSTMADSLVEFMISLGALNDVPNVSLGKFGRTITEFVGTEIMGAIAGVLDMIMGDQMSSGMAKLPGFARKMVSFYTELTTLNDLPYVSFGRFSSLIGSVIAVDFTGLFTAIGDEVVAGISGESGKGMMDTFTEDLSALATAITDWAATMDSLKGVTIDTKPIDDAIEAVSAANKQGLISTLSNAIANFFSDDDKSNIEQFGQDINDLGAALLDFQTQFGDVSITIDNAGIQELINSLNLIKGVDGGGLFGAIEDFFTGSVEENIAQFKTQMPMLGEAITEFNDSLGGNIDVTKMAGAAEALSYLGKFAESASYGFQASGDYSYLFNYVQGLADTVAPELNRFVSQIEDMSGLATLSASLEQLSTGMQTLSTIELDTGDIYDGTIVDTMTTNVETLKSMITSLTGIDTSGVDKLTSAANKLNGINIDKTQDAISKAKAGKAGSDSGKELASGMANAISSDTSVSTAMSTVASGGASAAKAQSGAYSSAGTSLMVALASAITSNRDLIKTAMSTAANKAVEAVKSHKSDMKSLGGDFARGFASGITENTSFVVSAARAMVERAKNAAKNAQDSNSPSRDTYKFGRWFVQGYKNAIHDYKKEPADEARSMTQGTVTALGEALNAVSDMLDTDDEFQPTITPILDLSDVESKASGISTLLDTSPTIGANLGAVSTNMSAMKQRTSMTDLLEAMEDLGSAMGSAHPVNNYNVNGVTYDDGTNVASAVGDLVRAVNIERRA